MTLPFLTFMKQKVKDTDIISVMEEAYRVSSLPVEELEQILKNRQKISGDIPIIEEIARKID